MADIEEPIDLGRVTHLTAQMHRSEDDAGDPIPDGFLLAADGARGHTWTNPAGITVAAAIPMTVFDPTTGNWLPFVDGSGNQIMATV